MKSQTQVYDLPTILLVEDNEGDAVLTLQALAGNATECDVIVLDDGEQAINYLEKAVQEQKKKLPDLILLDLNLPKIDGREVLQFIKGRDLLKKIPVVMLTTSSLQTDINYAYNNHANCYIVKSGNLTEFNGKISSLQQFWMHCVTFPNKN
jgi:CheY-like chemotaxis protein